MNYEETLEYINSIPKFSAILGNDNLKLLLSRLGNPQDKLSFVHVAGTNGKGSVCAMTASILGASRYIKVGLFTSPFIEIFNERIQINGRNISDNDLAEAATVVKNEVTALGIEISAFAQITAMAFLYFAKKECDIVVLEAGLGGRLDATNVITTPKVCAITKIGLDHTEYLGDTIKKIAAEKCGIIKSGTPVVTCKNQDSAALVVIDNACRQKGAELYVADKFTGALNLAGAYQQVNAGIAQKIGEILEIPQPDITAGLLNASWMGRFEYLRDNLILDGAHNPDGLDALINSLKKLNRNVIFVTAMMEDKNISQMAEKLAAFAKKVIVTQVNLPRCMKAEALAKYFLDSQIEENSITAVNKALDLCRDEEIVCVCGSLYLIGEIRPHFKA